MSGHFWAFASCSWASACRTAARASCTGDDSNVAPVIVTDFVGPYSQQVRVMGEAVKPKAIPYRENMSVLDVMIDVGGLTPFAAGDRAVIARRADGREEQIPVRLNSLLQDGDVSANVPMRPGDILIIPKSWF